MGWHNHTRTVALAVAFAIIVTSGSLMDGAMAQITCLQLDGSEAPFADAAAAVQAVRLMDGKCCQSSTSQVCNVVEMSGNAAISVCGPTGFCPACSDVGTFVNQVLAQCVTQSSEVLGYMDLDGRNNFLYYITSATHPPGGT